MQSTLSRFASLLLPLSILFSACTPLPTTTSPTATLTQEEVTNGDWYDVYFSDPGGPNAGSQRGGPDSYLAEAIDQARASVDVALYDLNLWSIRDALINAAHRGVAVRVVAESDNLDRPEFQELIAAGIPVLGDRHEALMHDKFAIIDHYEVWTGSMNMTLNGAYHNNNNLIRIRSTRLAQDYQTEFDEMFVDDLFGDSSPANTPYPSLTIEGSRVDVFFSPDDGVQDQIVNLINQARESVYFLAFAFTADPIRDALIAAQGRGVIVGGVIETDQASGQGGDYETLLNAGINVRLDGNRDNMHHKVFIIDGQIVVTGSYNFSRSAEDHNDENALVLYSPEIAALYLGEFDKVFANGR